MMSYSPPCPAITIIYSLLQYSVTIIYIYTWYTFTNILFIKVIILTLFYCLGSLAITFGPVFLNKNLGASLITLSAILCALINCDLFPNFNKLVRSVLNRL